MLVKYFSFIEISPRILKSLTLGFLAIISVKSMFSQSNSSSKDSIQHQTSKIEWVKQFPPLTGSSEHRSTKDKIIDFVIGKKEQVSLIKPVSVYARNPDTLWVLDQGICNVFRIENEVGEIPHIRNNEFKNLISLVGICSFKDEKLLFTDSFLNKLFVLSPGRKELTVLNDTLILDQPTGVAYSPITREIWVVETKSHRISVFNENGELMKRIGQRGTSPGEFNYPTSIWIDKSGKVFLVDAMNFRIQIFSGEGEYLSSFGKTGDATGYFARSKGIATDSSGNIYVVDALFNAVQIFDQTGNFLHTFGARGREKGEFWMPSGIFIDKNDFIYVADCYNARIQVFQRISGGAE